MQIASDTCCCETIGAPKEVRLCSDHHLYWDGDKRLSSVSSVLSVLPASYDGVPESVVESARERGEEVDRLVTSYVRGQLTHIPAGTREDSADLFLRLFVPWWDKMQFNEVFAQAIVHDEWVAGMLDLRANGIVFDVKCTYNLLPRHFIQVAAYSDLSADEPMALIHLSKRFKEPRIVDVPDSAREDWRTTRKFWELTRR